MNLEALVEQVKHLLPSPQVLPKLLTILEDPDANAWEIVDLVKLDTALTTQVLALSNSAFFGFTSPSTDLEEAVNRLGFRELYKLVSLVLCKKLVGTEQLEAYLMEEGELWEHSVVTAVAAENVAGMAGEDTSLAYTLGLMHCIGKFAINQLGPEHYDAVYERIESGSLSMLEAETEVFGFNHAEAGAVLMEHWKFPPSAYTPIRYQYAPQSDPSRLTMTSVLHAAVYVAALAGANHGRDAWAFHLDEQAFRTARQDEKSIQEILITVKERLADIKGLISMPTKA